MSPRALSSLVAGAGRNAGTSRAIKVKEGIHTSVGSRKAAPMIHPREYKKFTPKGLKKHYELFPLVGFIGTAVCALCTFAGYFWYTRPEITMFRGEGAKLMMDTMDLTNPPHLKILRVNDLDRSLPEVAALYGEMEAAAAERR